MAHFNNKKSIIAKLNLEIAIKLDHSDNTLFETNEN